MPSPVSHAAVPYVASRVAPRAGRSERRDRFVVAGVLLLAAWIPDIDLVIRRIWTESGSAFAQHGGATHSFVFALGLALAAGLAWRLAYGQGAVRMAALCFACTASHAVMDALTWGRGVMMFWPWTSDRILSPVSLFVGVHRSQPDNWMLHAATVANEAVFVGLLWLVARRIGRSRARRLD